MTSTGNNSNNANEMLLRHDLKKNEITFSALKEYQKLKDIISLNDEKINVMTRIAETNVKNKPIIQKVKNLEIDRIKIEELCKYFESVLKIDYNELFMVSFAAQLKHLITWFNGYRYLMVDNAIEYCRIMYKIMKRGEYAE